MKNNMLNVLRKDKELYIIDGEIVEVNTISLLDIKGKEIECVVELNIHEIEKYKYELEKEENFSYVYNSGVKEHVEKFIEEGRNSFTFFEKKHMSTTLYSNVDISKLIKKVRGFRIFNEQDLIDYDEIENVEIMKEHNTFDF